MMIAVYGAGYVGLVSAVCFAKIGHQVICADINEERITTLRHGDCPIYEEQLPQLLKEQILGGRLQFTADISYAIKRATIHLIATGTPSMLDGSADLSQVYAVATQIAREATADGLFVIKSTVPVGTGTAIEAHLKAELAHNDSPVRIEVVSNPEFMREGSAVHDFLKADRIILGGTPEALSRLKMAYQPLLAQGIPMICMSRQSAELTKYAANAMLACRVSFINQMSRIAEQVGANIDEITQGMGADRRIGPHFLQAGIGYGGSCFPKDGRALVQTARSLGIEVPMLDAIDRVNRMQKNWANEQLNKHFNHVLQNKTIGIWGLSFKPDTDDIREASSLVIIDSLLAAGAKLRLFDPVAMPAMQAYLPHHESITWCRSADSVVSDPLDALVIATEWHEFKTYSLSSLQAVLLNAPIIDGRNCFDLSAVEQANISFYYSVGRPTVTAFCKGSTVRTATHHEYNVSGVTSK